MRLKNFHYVNIIDDPKEKIYKNIFIVPVDYFG